MGFAAPELRRAVRLLLHCRWHSLLVLTTVLLALTVNAAVLSVGRAVFSSDGPLASNELVHLAARAPRPMGDRISAVPIHSWLSSSHAFSRLAVYVTGMMTAQAGNDVAAISAARVSAQFPQIVGARTIAGRWFLETEVLQDVAVLNQRGCAELFRASSQDCIGRLFQIDGRRANVLGVVDDALTLPSPTTVVWLPLDPTPQRSVGSDGRTTTAVQQVFVLAELAPATPLSAADSELQRFLPDDAAQLHFVRLQAYLGGGLKSAVVTLQSISALILLIAGTNVSVLALMRRQQRRDATTVRLLLGAPRWRVVCETALETGVLLGASAIGALVAADWVVTMVRHTLGSANALVSVVHLDHVVIAATVIEASILGILAVILETGVGSSPLQSSAARTTLRRSTRMLIAIETAIAFALVMTSALLTNSVLNVLTMSRGFDADHVVAIDLRAPLARYSSPHQRNALFQNVLKRLKERSLDAALTTRPPIRNIADSYFDMSFTVPSIGGFTWVDDMIIAHAAVTPRYFDVMKIPLFVGSYTSDSDRDSVVVSEGLARARLGGPGAVGRAIVLAGRQRLVSGVVGDVKEGGRGQQALPIAYFSFLAQEATPADVTLVARSAGSAAQALRTAEETLRTAEPSLLLTNASTLRQRVERTQGPLNLLGGIVSVFAVAATALALIGIGGALAYEVRIRQRELGVRIALGATSGTLFRAVLRDAATMLGLGLVLGLPAMMWGRALVRWTLFNSRMTQDVATAALFASVAVLVGLVSAFGPALAAARTDAAALLRSP